MRHFQLISRNCNMLPLLVAVKQQEGLWNQNTLRQDFEESPHKEVDDIWLRFQDTTLPPEAVVDEHECVPFRAWFTLPQARALVRDLVQVVEGTRVGRVIITRLPPGKQISPHKDMGSVAEYYQRYQFVLQSGPGCTFHIEEEQTQMEAGEVWWINNRLAHAVVNNSPVDRIVMICDLRSDRA